MVFLVDMKKSLCFMTFDSPHGPFSLTGSISSESYSFSEVSYEGSLPEPRNVAVLEEARTDTLMRKEELSFRRSVREVSLASNQYEESPSELAKSREKTERYEASSLSMKPTVSYQTAAAPLSEGVIINRRVAQEQEGAKKKKKFAKKFAQRITYISNLRFFFMKRKNLLESVYPFQVM